MVLLACASTKVFLYTRDGGNKMWKVAHVQVCIGRCNPDREKRVCESCTRAIAHSQENAGKAIWFCFWDAYHHCWSISNYTVAAKFEQIRSCEQLFCFCKTKKNGTFCIFMKNVSSSFCGAVVCTWHPVDNKSVFHSIMICSNKIHTPHRFLVVYASIVKRASALHIQRALTYPFARPM